MASSSARSSEPLPDRMGTVAVSNRDPLGLRTKATPDASSSSPEAPLVQADAVKDTETTNSIKMEDFQPRKACARTGSLSKPVQIKRELMTEEEEEEETDEEVEEEEEEDDDHDYKQGRQKQKPLVEKFITINNEGVDNRPLELPLSEDGSLPLETLHAFFPGASGLARLNQSTGNLQIAHKTATNRDKVIALFPVVLDGEPRWGPQPMMVIWPRKRARQSEDVPKNDDDDAPPCKRRCTGMSTSGASSNGATDHREPPAPRVTAPNQRPSVSAVSHSQYQTQRRDTSRPQRHQSQMNDGCLLVVKDVPPKLAYSTIKAYFDQYFGRVTSVKRGRNPLWAHVYFASSIDARAAMGNHSVHGADLLALPQNFQRNNESTVFVHNIPFNMNQAVIKEYFQRYGQVAYVWKPFPKRPRAPSYAFVIYLEVNSAGTAKMRSNHMINGYSVRVDSCKRQMSGW